MSGDGVATTQRERTVKEDDRKEPTSLGGTKVTKNAEPTRRVKPEIPDSLRGEKFRGAVTARFTIQPNGSFTVSLVARSGNSDVDSIVLDALRDWKWNPALKDGVKVRQDREIQVDVINQ